jgi:carboxymethylenebutenolidase
MPPETLKNRADLNVNRRQLLKFGAGCAAASLLLNPQGLASAWSWKSDPQDPEVVGENVQYPSRESKIDAYVAKPKGPGTHTSLIVIHDDGGLDDHIRSVASSFAAAGFFVLAPDLLSRSGGMKQMKTAEQAARAINELSVNATLEQLNAGFSALRRHLNPSADPVSVVGFGWGGWRTFLLAANQPALSKAVVYTGSTPTTGLNHIEAPFLAHYAQFDFRISGNALWTEKEMKALGKQFTYYIYPQVDHSFHDDTSPQYDAAAAKLAWSRTLDFLRGPQ